MHRVSPPLKVIVQVAISIFFCSAQAASLVLPSEEEVKGIERLCGGGRSDLVSIRGDVNAVIKNWKNASAGAGISAAKEQLAGFLNRIKDDANLAPAMKIYVDCVDRTLQRFIEQANRQPIPVSRSGRSGALLRSAFTSEEEMSAAGCDEAEDIAKSKLRQDCGDRQLIVLGTRQCSRSGQSPRTYVVELQGECRVKN